ncbi:MAG: mannose-6-phosphate isomerase, class I [Microbacterium sp.]|nr:MAG: mannose-6-phosphate isomerase, class I [Microbacterium sp.]
MLIPISNTPREYSWGSQTLIPALEGRVPTGRPEAEVWFGAHPGSPSRADDGRTLDAVLAGAGHAPLPYLLKILAAGRSLSIQAHPSVPEAVAGFAREEAAGIPRDADHRTYRDDNHKPEIIVALSDRFRALVGLRPLEDTRRLLAGLGDAPGITALRHRLSDDDAGGRDDARALRDTLAWVLSDDGRAAVDDVIGVLSETPAVDGFAEEIEVLRTIAGDFPGDPGVVVALLMNLVVLRRGEALFAPAGVLHAYQDGLGVELMAASDNVLRGGLTPKHVDVAELLAVVDTTPGPAPIVRPTERDGEAVYDVGVADFRLGRVAVTAGEPVELAVEGPTILLVTAGEVEISGSDTVRIPTGRAAFASADEGRLMLSGAGEVFVARPGRA